MWTAKSQKTFDRVWVPFVFLAMSFTVCRFVYQVREISYSRRFVAVCTPAALRCDVPFGRT